LEQKTLRLFLWKNFIYTLLILLAYLLQETPALFPVALRPVLVISMVTAIAMNEGEFSGDSTGLSSFWVMFAILLAGGLFGLFGGLLCDTAVFHIFGAASIFFLVLGCGCGLLIIYLIQPTVRSAFLLSGSFALIYGLAAHYLIYGMWGYEGAARLLFTRTFPSAVSTAVFGMGCFWLVWKIRLAFEDAAR
jgi:hypothetical protein